MRMILAAACVVLAAFSAAAGEKTTATLYKNPQCLCCEEHANYLRSNGIAVKTVVPQDMSAIRRQYNVPPELGGCHTMVIDGYVVEGHVPIATIKKLLSERPNIKGISLPGMPAGSPGMTGTKEGPFTIFAITEDGRDKQIYATE